MLRSVIVICVIAYFSTFVFGGLFTRGKVKVELERIKDCEDQKPLSQLNIRYDRCNKTHRCINANITVDEDVTTKSIIDVVGAKWGNGGWKPNAFHIKLNDVCKSLRKVLGENWPVIIEQFGMGQCPPVKGTYILKDYFVDFNDLPVAFMFGKFDILGTVLQNDKLLYCKGFILDIHS